MYVLANIDTKSRCNRGAVEVLEESKSSGRALVTCQYW